MYDRLGSIRTGCVFKVMYQTAPQLIKALKLYTQLPVLVFLLPVPVFLRPVPVFLLPVLVSLLSGLSLPVLSIYNVFFLN